MTTSKLPFRPSLESLRKQAKKLARAIAAGDRDAIERARAQLPKATMPLSQRDAQLVLAREYGFSGWTDLTKEVSQRLGRGLEWAVPEARRRIHDNDTEGLRQLLAEYPGLLRWRSDENDGGLLGMASDSFGDSFDAFRERHYTRAECAELLIDAGAVVAPQVCERLLAARARGLLALFHRKGILPRSLRFLAALGDVDGVRACLDQESSDAAVKDAFLCACGLQQADAGALLLERSIGLAPELGRRIDSGPGRSAFVAYFMEHQLDAAGEVHAGLWEVFVMQQVVRAVHDGDLSAFSGGLRRDAWMLADGRVGFQVRLIELAVLHDRADFIHALFDLEPAVLDGRVPPPSQAIEFAFTYGKTHVLPEILRVWSLPDDLPHAAGSGDFVRVRRWFDEAGKPALGDLAHHFPANSDSTRRNLQWGEPRVQQVLDTSLAWAVINNHFEIAGFLLERGADINTTWSSHEPASILHELAISHQNYSAMQFLIDHGIDMTMVDYRWGATAEGWARHAARDEKMATWLRSARG